MVTEDPTAALMAVVKVGPHKVEARDGSGQIVASEQFDVSSHSRGFLWTPLPNPKYRFFLWVESYGQGVSSYELNFDSYGPLRAFPKLVSHWFRDTPKVVSARKGTQAAYECALRVGVSK
jgi:hypothetical protein